MDIFKEEKFEKGGVVLERIHPDLAVEPYVPYYERMGYVVSIVEKPNGWVELIGEKKDTFEDAYGRFKDDIRENFTPRKMAKGGKIKELETDEFTYYVDENGENVEMYRNSDNSLVSDNYFAENDLYERMQEIANGREKYVYINPDSLEYLDEYKYARGGRTRIENDGVDFNEEMYRGILGDRDKDGVENADDVAPNNPDISDKIEKDTPFSDTFRTLLADKKMYDDSMYSIIGEMEKMLPKKFDIIARTKTPFSILKKLVGKKLKFKKDKYGNVVNKGLTDVIGTTIATNNNAELMNLRSMIGIDEGDMGVYGEVIEVDDKFKIPSCGYRAIHYIVLYNGVPVEIQLKTKRMKMLNEFSHPYYKAGDLDCDGMGELSEIVTMADNGSKEAQKEFADIFADKDRMRSIISKSFAKGGEITTWNWGGEPMLAFTKVDYDVNVNPSNLEVDVNIKESDSVDHYALNDTDAEWTQYSWGYMVYPKNEKQLYDVLKALRVSVSKQRLSDWFKSGGKSYAKGGEVEWFDYSKIDLEPLPYDLDRYFIKDADTKEIDLKLLEPTRAREKGVKNANKYMRMAYDGEIDRRKPISVYERNGKMYVFDGNSTIANAKNSGWKTIYVEMIDDPNDDFERGGRTKAGKLLSKIDIGNIIPTNKGNFEIIGFEEDSGILNKYDGGFSYFKVKDENGTIKYMKISREENPKMFINNKPLYSSSWSNAEQIFAKGGEVGSEFDYMMLGRLQNDVEYYLGHGARSPRVLYYRDSPKEHIEAMKEIWNRLPTKPEWLPKEKLDFYEMQLLSDLS